MKSKKALFVIIPVCIAFVAAIVLTILFATGAFLSPKARVMIALSKTFGSGSIFSEYSGNSNVSEYGYAPEYLAHLFSVSDTFTSMKERGYSFESSFALTNLDLADYDSDTVSDVGLKATGDVDTVNRIAYYDLTLLADFLRFDIGQYYISDQAISMEMPNRFEGYLTLPTETFGSSYNASVFPSIIGPLPQELESCLSFSAFDLLCPSSKEDTFMGIEDNLSVVKDFYDAIDVEETGDTRSILIGTKKEDCKEYIITIDEEAILTLIEAYEDWYFTTHQETIDKYDTFYEYLVTVDVDTSEDTPIPPSELLETVFDVYKELLATDHEIYVYLDHKGRLAAASYEIELDFDGVYDILNDEKTSLQDTIDDVIDYDDIFGYLLDPGSFDFSGDNLDPYMDFSDDPDPSESCTISAEIIFHGREYLPERYEGSFLLDFNDGSSCEIDYTGENHTGDLHNSVLRAALALTDAGITTNYDVEYTASYQPEDHNLTAELTASDEYNAEILDVTLDSTVSLEDDTITLELEDMTLTADTESGKNSISLTADASISPLSDRVPIPEGRERDLLRMSEGDYEKLFEEILGVWW